MIVEVSLDKDVRFLDAHSRVMGNRVHLDKGIQVFDVYTNTLSGSGTPNGQVVEPLSLPLVPSLPPLPTFTPGSEDISVLENANMTVEPGSYGVLEVKKSSNPSFFGWSVQLC